MLRAGLLAFVLGIVTLSAVAGTGQWPSIQRQDPAYYPSRPGPPSSRTVFYSGRNVEFRYPDNWEVIETSNGLTVLPAGGFISAGLAYGMIISTFDPDDVPFPAENTLNVFPPVDAESWNLSTATDLIISRFKETNPDMRMVRNRQETIVAGREAITVEIQNVSPLGGIETDWLVTVLRSDGALQYFIGVAPWFESDLYRPVFERIIESVRFPD
jgi:hypothetical protein